MSGYDWVDIGSSTKITTYIVTSIIECLNSFWGFLGGSKVERLTRVILNLKKTNTLITERKYEKQKT